VIGSQPDLTPQMVALASALVRTANADDASLHRAIVKAERRLLELAWEVSGGVLAIQSATTPGLVHHADEHVCDCRTTRGWCWHRAAWFILSVAAAAGVAPLAPVRRLSSEPQPAPFYDDRELTDPTRTDYPFIGDYDDFAITAMEEHR
jgi:hypothetical protein